MLITRPEPQAGRFAAALAERFGPAVAPLVAPLMAAEWRAPTLPPGGPFAAVVLTSETGAQAAGPWRQALPARAFCVGEATAAAARARGFAPDLVAADAAALARALRALPDPGPLVWLRGEDAAADLAALLPGLHLAQAVVYAQRPCPLSAEARALLARPGAVAVPLFSPRSARLFLAAAAAPVATLLPVAISPRTAAMLPEDLRARAGIAETPDAPGMLQALGRVLLSCPP